MLPTRRMCLGDLNPHLVCVLCGGYFVDATTIIECLHSFCKTCIVKFLETSKYCPICDVQVHKTRPLQNIRSDQTLQDIVYKLVPGLFQNEMRQRREFYSERREAPPLSKEDSGEVTETCYIYTADEPVSLSLQYSPSFKQKQSESEIGRRYLRCPAAVTVAHLQKLLRAKHGLSNENRVDICHEADTEPLSNNFSLMDVAYIHQWKRKGPMNFHYQIFERPCKRRCLEDISKAGDKASEIPVPVDSLRKDVPKEGQSKSPPLTSIKIPTPPPVPSSAAAAVTELVSSEKEEEWKEVQLQISEAGIMKVTNLAVEAASETIISSGRIDNPSEPKEEEKSKPDASQQNKSDINGNNKDIKNETVSKKEPVCKPSTPPVPVNKDNLTLPTVDTPESITLAKKQPEIKEHNPVSTPTSVPLVKPKEEVDKTVVVKEKKKETPQEINKPVAASSTVKKSTSTSVGYKTLKTPPKSWNPSVSRGSYLSSHSSLSKAANIAPKPETLSSDTSRPTNISVQNKAPRFFKERDRPRFLGNPLSGVKPMYQIQSDRPASSSSMIKIDPKTLSPMSSKSVVTSHNNNHISCNTITTGTGTITTTVASKRSSMPSMKPSVPPILHPPPNPMLYNYTSLMNSPLIRAPLMSPNSPHPFPPYPLPQSMFYGSQPTPRFQPSPPTVQRVPANVHSQKSPTLPSTVPTESQQLTSKPETTKVNGDIREKINSKSVEVSKTFTPELAKPSKVSDPIINNNNISNNNSNTCETSTSSLPVAPKVQAEEPVPPQASK